MTTIQSRYNRRICRIKDHDLVSSTPSLDYINRHRVLLLIAASRVLRTAELGMNQMSLVGVATFGTTANLLWTPYDWPPGYFLTLA